MKKPTLRLRQVFEGPTHFKVVKPLGNPIKIAKKGLSPNLMGRLRKFSKAGEVTDPVDDTTIQESDVAPTEVRVIGLDNNTEAGEQPALVTPPPLAAEGVKPSGTRPRPKRSVQTTSAIPAPTDTEPTVPTDAPAPVVLGAVSGRPKPRRANVTPQIEPVAAVTGEVVPAQPAAVETEPAAPATEQPAPVEPSLFERALGLVNFDLAKYEAASPEMKPIIRQAAQAAFTAKAAADADVSAAEAETSALAAEQAAQKEELQRLQKSADEARTIQKNILTDFDYLKNPTTYLGSMSTLGQIGTAISLAAGAFASGMTGMPNFAQKIYDNAIEQDLQAQKRRADSLYQRLVQAGNSVENAENMVRAQLKLVGAAEQTRRAAEIKLPQVKAKIQAEAAKQALDATNTLQRIAKDQASMAYAAQKAPLELAKLGQEIQKAPLEQAKIASDIETARLHRKKVLNDIAARDREFKQKQDELELRRQERIDAAEDKKEKDLAERGLTIGNTELELKSKTGSKDVRDNIAAREQAMMSILKLESLFKKKGLSIYNPLSEARIEAIEELATFIEQYPKAAGFKRAISLSAAKQLKEGLQSPAGGFALVRKILGADPTVAITGIRKEVQRSYADQVRSVVRNPQSDVVNDAILSAYAKADEEIEKYEMMQTADKEL